MSSRDLPARPSLDHLKNEAKALRRAFDNGDADAVRRVRDAHGEKAPFKLTDAQRVIAREYGFPSWARLRVHVEDARRNDTSVSAFLEAVQQQNSDRAQQILATHPDISSKSLHAAAALGLPDVARRLIAENPAGVTVRVGSPAADPLLFLCYSPFHGESAERDAGLLATARVLLDAGADPNTRDERYGVPALHGVTGHRSVLPIARLLLDAGANPNDGESVFHAAEHFHEDALELLLQAGADLNYVGEWGNTAAYFLLRWWDLEREPRVQQGLRWLLAHGADPNVRSGKERETALHVAARRGQSVRVVQLLLDYGANVNTRREDGATAWLLARRGGFDAIASLLERAGAETQPLTVVDELLAACGRGDVAAARRLTSPSIISTLGREHRLLLREAASTNRTDSALAYVAAGFPVNATDESAATALHFAALHGNARLSQALLEAGADVDLRDNEHSSTPLGWACFGADNIATPGGDYVACVRVLIGAGARHRVGEYVPQREDVRALLEAPGGL